MRAVLDTNVVASGLFFGGVPRAILDLVADGAFELVLSPTILEEYQRIYARLATGHPPSWIISRPWAHNGSARKLRAAVLKSSTAEPTAPASRACWTQSA